MKIGVLFLKYSSQSMKEERKDFGSDKHDVLLQPQGIIFLPQMRAPGFWKGIHVDLPRWQV